MREGLKLGAISCRTVLIEGLSIHISSALPCAYASRKSKTTVPENGLCRGPPAVDPRDEAVGLCGALGVDRAVVRQPTRPALPCAIPQQKKSRQQAGQ
jgi:hypothetical protein